MEVKRAKKGLQGFAVRLVLHFAVSTAEARMDLYRRVCQ